MPLFLLFLLLLPLVEIALFVQLGGVIGLWPTLGLVVASALLGVAVLRHQGIRLQQGLREAAMGLRDPLAPVAEGAAVFAAGLLLLIPGFLTDLLALPLLLPPLRRRLLATLARRSGLRDGAAAGTRDARGDVILDADYVEIRRGAPALPPEADRRH